RPRLVDRPGDRVVRRAHGRDEDHASLVGDGDADPPSPRRPPDRDLAPGHPATIAPRPVVAADGRRGGQARVESRLRVVAENHSTIRTNTSTTSSWVVTCWYWKSSIEL